MSAKLSAQRLSVAGPLRQLPYRRWMFLACAALALAINYAFQKEMAWDVLNYHLYAGFCALNDRFSQDYFAAGPQSYFNPYVFAPFYLLVKAGLPALLIASLLALIHSLIFWLIAELGMLVAPSADPRRHFVVAVLAVVLALLNPILLQQIGTSFADIITAELVLAGWLLLLRATYQPSQLRIIAAGALIGFAVALKLTNAVHAVSAGVTLFFLPLSFRARLIRGAVFGLAAGIAFVLTLAPWSYRLAERFGNPVFPLLNGIFRSPEYTIETMRHFRFIPDGWAEALWRPFAILNPTTMVQEELRAPDARYAALLVLALALLSLHLWRKNRCSRPTTLIVVPADRATWALACGFGLDWILWLSGSGNGRYFLPGASMAAVLLAGGLYRLLSLHAKARRYVISVLIAVQLIQIWMGMDYRWRAAEWGGSWFEIAIPSSLKQEANLYMTMGGQTNSFLAPYLAGGSGLINFNGGYALGPDGQSGARVKALLAQYAPHLQVLLRGDRLYEVGEKRGPVRADVDIALSPWGMKVDPAHCETIDLNNLEPEIQVSVADEESTMKPIPADKVQFVSCRIEPAETDYATRRSALRDADLVLNRLEDACPTVFVPRRPLTEFDGHLWLRRYSGTDISAWVSHGEVKFIQPRRGKGIVRLGPADAWLKAPLKLACSRNQGVYSASILP